MTEQQKQKRLEYSRAWRARNKAHVAAYNKDWVSKNPEYHSEWQRKNKATLRQRARNQYHADVQRSRQKLKQKRERFRDAYWAAAKRARDKVFSTPHGRINKRLRARIKEGIFNASRNKCRVGKLKECVGYTARELLAHLISQFTEGMTLEKLISGEIQIDHIRPLMLFRFSSTKDPQFKEAWALSNLRPLWATENAIRGANHRWQRERGEEVNIAA